MNKQGSAVTILRVMLGFTFLMHGWAKMQMGLGNVAGWFASMGIPSFMGYAVGYLELLGGVLLIIGLGTRVISALLTVVMAGAVVTVKWKAGFLGNGQGAGSELDFVLMAMTLYFVISGQVGYAADRLLFKKKKETLAS